LGAPGGIDLGGIKWIISAVFAPNSAVLHGSTSEAFRAVTRAGTTVAARCDEAREIVRLAEPHPDQNE